jgi:NAD(P)-dependent dehydrogenase (short-subunit alcohol dehydrogenase family)
MAFEGLRVAVVDADGPLGAPAVTALRAAGAAVAAVQSAEDGDATAGVELAIAELGGLDVLANLTKPAEGAKPALDVTRADFDTVFKRCLRATRTSNQAAFRHFTGAAGAGAGHVVNHAEEAGELGEAGRALPATVAQAVVAWSHAAAGAWFFQGVRVNIFQPASGADFEGAVLPTLLFLIGENRSSHNAVVSC